MLQNLNLSLTRANFVTRDVITHLTNCKFEKISLDNNSKHGFVNISNFYDNSNNLYDTETIIDNIKSDSFKEMFFAQPNLKRKVNLIDEINSKTFLKAMQDMICTNETLRHKILDNLDNFDSQISYYIDNGYIGDLRSSYDLQKKQIQHTKEYINNIKENFDIDSWLSTNKLKAQELLPDLNLLTYDKGKYVVSESSILKEIYQYIFQDETMIDKYYNFARAESAKFAHSYNMFSTKNTDCRVSGTVIHHTVSQNDDAHKINFLSDENNVDLHYAIPSYKVNEVLGSFLTFSLIESLSLPNKSSIDHDGLLSSLYNMNKMLLFNYEDKKQYSESELNDLFSQLKKYSLLLQNNIKSYHDKVLSNISEKEIYVYNNEERQEYKTVYKDKLYDNLDENVSSLHDNFMQLSLILNNIQCCDINELNAFYSKNISHKAFIDECIKSLFSLQSYKLISGAHFFATKDQGGVFCIAPQSSLVYHAGVSKYASDYLLNEKTLGIEIESLGSDDYPSPIEQRASVADLCQLLINNDNSLSVNNLLLTHQQITPRKFDPNAKTYMFSYEEQKNSLNTQDQNRVLESSKKMMDNLGIKSNTFIDDTNDIIKLIDTEEVNTLRQNIVDEYTFNDCDYDGTYTVYEDISVPYELAYIIYANYDANVSYQVFCDNIQKDVSSYRPVIQNNISTLNRHITSITDLDVKSTVELNPNTNMQECILSKGNYEVRMGTVLLAIKNLKNISTGFKYNLENNSYDFGYLNKEDYILRVRNLQKDYLNCIDKIMNENLNNISNQMLW